MLTDPVDSVTILQKLVGVLCFIQAFTGCVYIPVAGPKSEGVAEETTVETLIEENEFEVRRQLGEPQWLYEGKGHKYLIYQGWQQHGLVLMMPLGFLGPPPFGWLERRYCWLLEFNSENILKRVDRKISAHDCRRVFWTEKDMLVLEPGDAKTNWQLYAESTDPGPKEWHWLCRAADQGYSLARHRLGTIYYHGLYNVGKDPVLAYVWYRLAEETGPEVKQLDWIGSSLTTEQLVTAEQLIASWRAGRCERELLARVQRSQ
jgi:hypothetical protein